MTGRDGGNGVRACQENCSAQPGLVPCARGDAAEERDPMRRALAWLALIAPLCVAAAGAAGAWAWRALHTPVPVPAQGAVVFVPPGEPFRAVAVRLSRAGVVRHPLLLTLWARYH